MGGQVSAGEGAYYHVAMMNGRANQLTEMVPVERIYSELGRYIAAGATHYLLMNTSDIRPVPMTIRAVMETAWGGVPARSSFYRQWSADQFGEQAADRVAAVYEQYFKAPPHVPGRVTREYGDQLYHTEARRMILSQLLDSALYSIPSQAPPWMPLRRVPKMTPDAITTYIENCAAAVARWDAVWKAATDAEPLVARERLPFYRAHVLTAIAINRESNLVLLHVSRAARAHAAGRLEDARRELSEAQRACDEIGRAEAGAEYGRWTKWYAGDWLTNVRRTSETIGLYAQHLTDPLAPLPSPLLWDWEAYYHILHYEGDRSVDVR